MASPPDDRKDGRRASQPLVMPTLLAALFCLCAAVQEYRTWAGGEAIDFYQHWAIVHAVRERLVPSVYTDEGRQALGRIFAARADLPGASEIERTALRTNLDLYKGKLEVVGTPALYAALSPFVSEDYEADRKRFLRAQLGAVLAAALLFGAAVELPAWVALLLAAWAILFSGPVLSDLVVGSVSSLQWMELGVVVLIARTARGSWRDPLVGGALGLAAVTKPNLALIVAAVLLPLAIDRRSAAFARTVAAVGAGALVGVAGAAAWFGRLSAWGDWARALPRVRRVTAGVDAGNMGLVGLLHEGTHRDLSPFVLVVVAAAVVAAVASSREKDRERSEDEVVVAIAVGGAATALAAPIFWLHYGVLVLPAALVAWRFGRRGEKWWTIGAAMLLSSAPRMLDGDLTRFAVGVVFAQVALFGMTLAAWVRLRRA